MESPSHSTETLDVKLKVNSKWMDGGDINQYTTQLDRAKLLAFRTPFQRTREVGGDDNEKILLI